MRRWIAAIMAGLAVVGLLGQPLFPMASAEPLPPEEVEALNKWVNWDPTSGCEDTASADDVATGNLIPDDQIPGKDNRQKIWNYLIALGFKPVEAAGIVGNIGREGVYDPTNIEDPAGTTKDWDVLMSLTATNQGYGLIGFTPGRSLAKGDTTNVDWSGIAKVDVNKDNFYYISTQLAVVRGYMKNSTAPSGKNMLAEFEARSTSAAQAAVAFMDLVENPGVLATAERERFANDAMRDFGNIPAESILIGSVTGGGGGESCCPAGGAGAGTPTDKKGNEATIWNFLVGDMKLSDKQAAGIMGNIEQESGFSPTALNPSSGAYGIVQWYAGRNTALSEFAASKGKPKSDMQVQLEFLRVELEGSYKDSVLKPIQNSDDLTEITRIWLESFEIPCIPGSSACDAEMDIRLPNAKRVLQEYAGTASDSTLVSDTSGCGGSGNQAGANGWELTGPNAMVVYDQCDSKWASKPYGAGKSSICESGCGIASLAMVVSTLTDKKETPASLAKKYGDKYHGSQGTDWSLWPVAARDYGLNMQDLGTDLDKAAKTVKAGGLVIISVDPGEFTSGGHLMVIRAVTDDGKFLLADPNNDGNRDIGNTNTTPYSADFLRTKGALKYLWGFTKQSAAPEAVLL